MTEQLILVTGGNSGIGQACVNRFLDKGNRVISVDLVHSQAPKLLNEFQEVFNLTELDKLDGWSNTIVAKYGVPDVIVNSAGISRMDFLVDSQLADLRDMFELNVFALYEVTKVF